MVKKIFKVILLSVSALLLIFMLFLMYLYAPIYKELRSFKLDVSNGETKVENGFYRVRFKVPSECHIEPAYLHRQIFFGEYGTDLECADWKFSLRMTRIDVDTEYRAIIKAESIQMIMEDVAYVTTHRSNYVDQKNIIVIGDSQDNSLFIGINDDSDEYLEEFLSNFEILERDS